MQNRGRCVSRAENEVASFEQLQALFSRSKDVLDSKKMKPPTIDVYMNVDAAKVAVGKSNSSTPTLRVNEPQNTEWYSSTP